MRDGTWRTERLRPMVAATIALALAGVAALPASSAAAQEGAACPDDNSPAPFTDRADIPLVHRANVDCAANTGITDGFADSTYRPTHRVRRDQMAAFVARTLDLLVDTGHGSLPPPPAAILGFNLERVRSYGSGSSSGFATGTASISGTQHERALGRSMFDYDGRTHVLGEEYDLGRAYTRLTATVGQADTSEDTSDTLRFLVFGDGEELQRVQVTFGQAMEIDADVTGVLRLRIETQNLSTDDTSGTAIAVWGTPTVR